LALALSKKLPRERGLPAENSAALQWQQTRREKLRALVHAKNYSLQAVEAGSDSNEDFQASYWWLKMGEDWTVPAVELVRRGADKPAKGTALLLADEGRRTVSSDAERLLGEGYRVLAVDLFGLGESKIKPTGFELTVDSVGDRPLGIQASQLAAVARWFQAKRPAEPLTVIAVGPRASLWGLVAAALEERAITGLELHRSLGSLKEVIERNWTAEARPEMFCFGLLEAFDIQQLTALVAPRPVAFVEASPRAKEELSGLRAWYAALGKDFDPLR
jgi:hypothetical protein